MFWIGFASGSLSLAVKHIFELLLSITKWLAAQNYRCQLRSDFLVFSLSLLDTRCCIYCWWLVVFSFAWICNHTKHEEILNDIKEQPKHKRFFFYWIACSLRFHIRVHATRSMHCYYSKYAFADGRHVAIYVLFGTILNALNAFQFIISFFFRFEWTHVGWFFSPYFWHFCQIPDCMRVRPDCHHATKHFSKRSETMDGLIWWQ